MAGKAYAGQRRRKQTPWSVKFGDALFSRIIAVGGIGTIVAILLVVLVLLGTALPLLRGPEFQPWAKLETPAYRHVGVDADGVLLWGMTEEGEIEVRETLSSAILTSHSLPEDQESSITSSFVSIDRKTVGLGFSDGSVRFAEIEFEDQLIGNDALPAGMSLTAEHPVDIDGETIYQRFDNATSRKTWLGEIAWSNAYQLAEQPILALDYIPDSTANRFARTATDRVVAVAGDSLVYCTITKTKVLNKVREEVAKQQCELLSRSEDGRPMGLMVLNNTGQAVLVWPSGTLDRYTLADGQPELLESQGAVVGGTTITCTAPLLARQAVLCGTDDGQLQAWSIVRQTEGEPVASDGLILAQTHTCQVGNSPLLAVTSSSQSHAAAVADEAGNASLVYVTNDTLLGSQGIPLSGAVGALAIGPDGNILVASAEADSAMAAFDVGHPEASLRGYFGKVWYEAHDEPKYIWQSSAATEEAEIKLSLMPLVFGTMKATVYAMLISIPLAILAAIYTSEFLSPSARTKIKPIVELMASLPSVVLGYVAALVVAPHLEAHLMAVLVCLMLVPMTFVLAGHLWNLLPVDRLVRYQGYRLPLMFVCLPLGFALSFAIASVAERVWFYGSIVEWLSGQGKSPVGGWILLLIPGLSLAAILLLSGPLSPWVRSFATRSSPRTYALVSLARFFATAVAVVAIAWGGAIVLSSLGLDLRGHFFDNYQDKNALLVGGALGFCVIPIIYTISDDALQAVPQQLRSASLGCGATPWQTTVRVVVPSAMSGLFSAIMIGLGRAVGETMVVLCAAGNTPLMEWNVFNGFKTLSAALATELPEAAKGSTHFRTLFLAALLLFFLTLIANTLAEFVRIRFRKRASQL